jgi:hypothetical protein
VDGIEVEMAIERDGEALYVSAVAGDDVAVIIDPDSKAGTTVTLTRIECERVEEQAAEMMMEEESAARDAAREAAYDARNDR